MAIPESGQLVVTLLNDLINEIKTPAPLTLDGSSLTMGFVYSQLASGQMVDPNDYANPWAPAPGSTPPNQALPNSPSMDAAFKFAQLVDTLLMVTKDNSYLEFPTGRKVSITYQNLLQGMTALPAPPISQSLQAQVDNAQKVLYNIDADGNYIQTSLYKTYQANSLAYAKAKTAFADAQATAMANPATANTWPVDSAVYQNAVDQTYNTMVTEGAQKVEDALAVSQSIGISIPQAMISNSKQLLKAWNVNIAGVPTTTPYTYASPSNWSDPDSDDSGWTELQVSQSDYSSVTDSSSSAWSAGGSGFFGFFDSAGANASGSNSSSSFSNDSSGLSIDMEYGVVTINRPWFTGDLFYLKNWYLTGAAKDAISNGTLDGQDTSLFPMIPVQFLCIRNVKITANDWKSDGQAISSRFSGGGGFNIGFISFGANYSTSKTHSSFGWSFDGATLSIHGTQIVAYLSEIVPANAPLDDPGLANLQTSPN